MDYRIAVASSDGINIDTHFGGAKSFRIYEVKDGVWSFLEERMVPQEGNRKENENGGSAGPGGCSGPGNGCSAGPAYKGGCGGGPAPKVDIISDCRCVVCLKIGFQVQKQLERKAISAFDVGCTIEEALEKITVYYKRVDSHESLRRQR